MAAPKRTKRARKPVPTKTARDLYVAGVLAELETDPMEMSKLDYLDALEEIAGDVDSRIAAVNEELERGEP